jgi:hypothetical protein
MKSDMEHSAVRNERLDSHMSVCDNQWPTWLFEYDYEGKTWCFHLPARTAQEAQDRVKRLALYGRFCGELYATIPVPEVAAAPMSLLARLFCWWKNR